MEEKLIMNSLGYDFVFGIMIAVTVFIVFFGYCGEKIKNE